MTPKPPRIPEHGYWRALAEMESTFPAQGEASDGGRAGDDAQEGLSRRQFARLLGASVALATGAGCSRSVPDKVVPYVVQPPEVTPGVPNIYATSTMLDGYATGLLVESHEGRPTKIEGNPEHPASLGATGPFEQALILQLYDPDRARRPRRGDAAVSWREVIDRLAAPRTDRGAGLRLLLEPTSSPLTHGLVSAARARHPDMGVIFRAATSSRAPIEGARAAFGRALTPLFDLSRAEVVLALDADLLGTMPFRLRHARDFADRRRSGGVRLYVVETMLSVTGSMADNRLRRRGADLPRVAAAIASALGGLPGSLARPCTAFSASAEPEERRWADIVARDLRRRAPGSSVVVVGERQPAALHALAYAMNVALGNVNVGASATPAPLAFIEAVIPATIVRTDAASDEAGGDLTTLAAEARDGRVDTLVMMGGDPGYDAPADLDWGGAVDRIPETIYAGLYENETSATSRWFIPLAHELESWGDGRAYDGTLSLMQPLIRPLHDGRTVTELLAALAGNRQPDGHALLRASLSPGVDWEASLARGFVENTAVNPVSVSLNPPSIEHALSSMFASVGSAPTTALEIDFYTSPTLHDGRFANNAWLQELPTPIGKLTWDNAALLSPTTARALGVESGERLELKVGARSLEAPVLIIPGHADGSASLWLGYGRGGAERVASGVGVSAYHLRMGATPWFAPGVARKIPGLHRLALTQEHWTMEGRPIAMTTTRAELRRAPHLTDGQKGPLPSLMNGPRLDTGPQWAMSIDTSVCTGCNACVVACQAENNVLIVGKSGVLESREMHWLRIDTYFIGGAENPGVVHQPMLCQHCEHAPCEYVCPVNATVHSPDGLNEMVYNRCVGTRFCSNNCPYKVRRFNWFDWREREPINQGLVKLQRNPDVTVRERGVMEKCSYCVQRIRGAEITARKDQREIAAGEVVTACAQACPTRAITFGSLTEADSEVARLRADARRYDVLHELGTRPRTTYLVRVDDPNEELG